MATIGTFTRGEDGSFAGTIRTLTLNVKASIKPVATDNDKAPDHRVYAGVTEFGAGWSKTSREGRDYLSLKLDDLSPSRSCQRRRFKRSLMPTARPGSTAR
ncbi:hypothetical protein ACFB49_22130 [Sphingomonas sp. DBB INV C78]|uniref:DUF736 domain-containing protein n=1 Tax=Sphingomonas sp. DBB INV C78 TaxID=3349434 RepID=UPI0036D3EF46